MKRTIGNTPRQVQHCLFLACVFPFPPFREVLCELNHLYWIHLLFLWFVPLYLFHCQYLRLLPTALRSCGVLHSVYANIQTD